MVAHTAFSFDTFTFTHRSIQARRIDLGYALTSRAGARVAFEETFELPETLSPTVPADDPAVARALLGLHLAAGTSYWKTCIPKDIVVENASLSPDDAEFWNAVYTLGLGEFFYRNQIDPVGRASFPTRAASDRSRVPARAVGGPSLLLWGGGKDSVVSHEVLKTAGSPHELLSIGRSDWEWVQRAARVANEPLHVVTRRLDPKLLEMNAAGALNGHVPVSATLAAGGSLVAVLAGRPAVIASNEASASCGNAAWGGIEVNHQWSKSLEFERLFRKWLGTDAHGGPEYFSLLRSLSELRIVKAFSNHPEYFTAVTSCNANFKQSGPAPRRFCLACPKCVFVSLMARPFLDDSAYRVLFGGDALADPGNLHVVEELLGVRGTKPFDCVGTPEETVAALHLASTYGRKIPHGIMTAFSELILSSGPDLDAVAKQALARSSDHELSKQTIGQLDDYLARH